MAKDEEKYTDSDLREKIKEEIKASDKGGKPGQWSARKSQLLTKEYEKRGGGYKGNKGESQKPREVDRGGLADSGGRLARPKRRRDGPLPPEASLGEAERR